MSDNLSVNYHLHDDDVRIECQRQHCDAVSDHPYPVLHIGDITIFPMVETLQRLRLRDVIVDYLEAEDMR